MNLQDELKPQYAEMVATIIKFPNTIVHYASLVHEIFLTSTKKLIFDDDGDLLFAVKNLPVSNFGAIVLSVETLHSIDDVFHELDLLVVSTHDVPRFTRVSSLDLANNLWIEKLGVSYQYINIPVIRGCMKLMAQYAPTKKIYRYSGWALDKVDTYILNGVEINARNFKEEHSDE